MPFDDLTGENTWATIPGHLEVADEQGRSWQFRFSVRPTRENLLRAAHAIAGLKQFSPGKSYPSLKIFLPREGDLSTWDGTLTGGDRNQLGKEICVYMDFDSRRNQYAFSAAYYKELILAIWHALEAAGVELSYIPTPTDEKALPTEAGVVTPVFYSSFKEYRSHRHGIMSASQYNEGGFVDPLHGALITLADLQRHHVRVPQYNPLFVLPKRIAFLENHLRAANETWLHDVQHTVEASDAIATTGTLAWLESLVLTEDEVVKAACWELLRLDAPSAAGARLPRKADADLTLLYDYGRVEREQKKNRRGDVVDVEALRGMLQALILSARDEITRTQQELASLQLPLEPATSAAVRQAVETNPVAMQRLYRRGYHIQTLQQALQREKVVFSTQCTFVNARSPASYATLWANTEGDAVAKAMALLRDYTKNDSMLGRFFTGHWNRHHIPEIVAITQGHFDTVPALVEALVPLSLTNPSGSLVKRIHFMIANSQPVAAQGHVASFSLEGVSPSSTRK